MSAEACLFPHTDLLIMPEKNRRSHPLPVVEDYYGTIPVVRDSLYNLTKSIQSCNLTPSKDIFEPPLTHSLNKMLDARFQAYPDYNISAYTLGSLYGKGMIVGQMAKDQIPDITDQELKYTSEVYNRIWDKFLPNKDGDSLYNDFTLRKHKEASIDEFMGNNSKILANQEELQDLHFQKFKKETSRRIEVIACVDPYLDSELRDVLKNSDLAISRPVTHGFIDIYCFYELFFNQLHRPRVA